MFVCVSIAVFLYDNYIIVAVASAAMFDCYVDASIIDFQSTYSLPDGWQRVDQVIQYFHTMSISNLIVFLRSKLC